MADEQDNEKTEEATDSRREEFRKRGQVAHTRELATALVLLTSAGLIYGLSQFFFKQFSTLFVESYGQNLIDFIKTDRPLAALAIASGQAAILIFPVLFISVLVGVMSSVVQIGLLDTEDALSPDLNKINPLEGFKRIFSMRSLVEGLKSILKISLIALVVYLLLRGEFSVVPRAWEFSIAEILVYMGQVVVKLLFGVGLIMLVLAGADYFFQKWDLEKKMMMTKQEVKEEHKQREGDPMIKARIRRVQREVANRRMMDAIPKADVVITNPTHIAVVLKYDDNLPAPQLVAKGADLIAEKIKAIAREHKIPVIENKPLARTIFKTMKIGHVIPRELFVAVAEVLSYVFKLRRKARRS